MADFIQLTFIIMRKLLLFIVILLFLQGASSSAARINPEKKYQDYWCKKHCGISEYKVKTGQRVDCLTTSHAIEFDFANKVYEGIGQAMFYSSMTGKKPGIVLIIENYQKDKKYLDILKNTAQCFGFDYWTISPKNLNR